ncbi:uncharacterized protein LOC126064259 isoform X1 [Elephas maximus indicus]|uniref:uncharacterized protein LOC126064259 isoform X1 n=1 Tax=Elephas maximus indicus TaxID=99487 RepID=UPI002116DC54|nr:uncharacterized protein LOC126064259 isoform X1 [Elephas maximus indicus]
MIRKTLIMQTSQKYTIWALLRWSGLKFQQLQAPSPPPEPLARRKGGEPHLLFRTVNSAAAVSVVPGRRKGPHQATGPEEDHILLLGIRHSPTCQGKGWRTDLCLGSYMAWPGRECDTMELPRSNLDELSWKLACPEPDIPSGLNQAWALDNFNALSHHSCDGNQFCQDVSNGARGLLGWACLQRRNIAGVERGQKLCRNPPVLGPMSTKELQSPPKEAAATYSTSQRGMNQPEDASRGGQTETQGTSEYPGHHWKPLKTKPEPQGGAWKAAH